MSGNKGYTEYKVIALDSLTGDIYQEGCCNCFASVDKLIVGSRFQINEDGIYASLEVISVVNLKPAADVLGAQTILICTA